MMEGAPAPPAPRPVRNVFANWGLFAFVAIANFFLSPFIVHRLGDDAYGTWVLLVGLVGYLALLDLGVRMSVTRFVARFHAVGDHREASRHASAGLFVFGLTSAAAVVVGIGLSFGIGGWFNIPSRLVEDARIAVVLSSVAIALALLNGVFGGIITGLQRFDVTSGIEACVESFRIVAVLLALSAGYGIVMLATIAVACGVLRLAATYTMTRRLYPQIELTLSTSEAAILKDMLTFSVAFGALRTVTMVVYHMDAIVIGWFEPAAMITFFAIAANLTHYARSMVEGVSFTITPRISALEGRGATEDTRELPLISGRIASLILMPIAGTFMLRGNLFLGLWMGPAYADLSAHVLWILSFALWFTAGREIMTSSVVGLNKHHALLPLAFAEAAISVILSIVLVQSMGVPGVAWATTLPALAFSAIVFPIVFERALGVRATLLWSEVWLRPTIAVFPFMVATWAIERYTRVDSLLGFFAQVAALLPLAFFGAWLFALKPAERTAIIALLPRRLRLTAD